MNEKSIITACEALIRACLHQTNAAGCELKERLEVLTKVTRYLEVVTPRLSVVRHVHDSQETADPLAQTMTDPDPTGGLRK